MAHRGAQSAVTIIEILSRQNAFDLGQTTLCVAQTASACLQERTNLFCPRGKPPLIRPGQGCRGGDLVQPGFDGLERRQVTRQ